ncbi:hypothetical protein B0O80DRAFT_425716 [Mortierella sp. GBAus27b]|nr:hypothetical protein B0O80DRAFT_425716 [Mortierella sp. GBAus27b]
MHVRSRLKESRTCKVIHNGPRPIDSDIPMYDPIEHHADDLVISHVAIQEPRTWSTPQVVPSYHPAFETALAQASRSQVREVVHKSVYQHRYLIYWDAKALVMGILKTTPGSFSDSGDYSTVEPAATRALQLQEDETDFWTLVPCQHIPEPCNHGRRKSLSRHTRNATVT